MAFEKNIARVISDRVCDRCSNPACRKATRKPHPSDSNKAINKGNAAHIYSEKKTGPRYLEGKKAGVTIDFIKSASNGVWLCNDCHTEVDRAESTYTPETLFTWKTNAEFIAARDSRATIDEINNLLVEIEQTSIDLTNFYNHFFENDPHLNEDLDGISDVDIASYQAKRKSQFKATIAPKIDRIINKSKGVLGENNKLVSELKEVKDGAYWAGYNALNKIIELLARLKELLSLR